MGFPTKNDHFGVWNGGTPIYGNTHVGHPWPGVLLTGADRLDPLSFLAIVSPMCGFCLAGRRFLNF